RVAAPRHRAGGAEGTAAARGGGGPLARLRRRGARTRPRPPGRRRGTGRPPRAVPRGPLRPGLLARRAVPRPTALAPGLERTQAGGGAVRQQRPRLEVLGAGPAGGDAADARRPGGILPVRHARLPRRAARRAGAAAGLDPRPPRSADAAGRRGLAAPARAG